MTVSHRAANFAISVRTSLRQGILHVSAVGLHKVASCVSLATCFQIVAQDQAAATSNVCAK